MLAPVVLDGALGPPRPALCPCISVVPEATHEASQGSKTETRELLGGTKENSTLPNEDFLAHMISNI